MLRRLTAYFIVKKYLILSLLFIFILLPLSLAGCGASETKEKAEGTETAGEEKAGDTKPEEEKTGGTEAGGKKTGETEAGEGKTDETGSGGEKSPGEGTDASGKGKDARPEPDSPGADRVEPPFSADPSLFPQTLADTEEVLFILNGCSYDSSQGYEWNVSIENRSGKTLLFSLDKVSHDGLMCDPFWAETVAAGKRSVTAVHWLPYTLEENGLTDITCTECILTVYNDEDYAAPAILRKPCRVLPRGETAADRHERTPSEDDVVLAQNDDCRVILTGIDAAGDWGYTLYLFLENLSDRDLIFSAENVSVNGIMADPYWACSVTAGKSSFSSVIWSRSSLLEKDIESVEKIELPLMIYNDSDYGDVALRETVTVTP